MSPMQHQHWINQARQHWQEFQPARFKALTESGQLETALRLAAESTAAEMAALMGQGATAAEAFEQVRELHLFPQPEPGAVEQQEPTEGYLAQVSLQRQMRVQALNCGLQLWQQDRVAVTWPQGVCRFGVGGDP